MSNAARRVSTRLNGLWLILALWALASPSSRAQEFNCQVSVSIAQITGSDFTFLQELDEQIELYMNERPFTQDRFQDIERIDCFMQVIFEEAITLTSFQARLVLSSRRPIYGVPQVSTVLQISDASWQFNYAQGTPLTHDLERFDPLTSVLDFYAYIMLGYDYDTFSAFGGTPYFERARRIAALAESQGAIGWSDLGDNRGRKDLIEQVLDPRFKPLRQVYFDYHYDGLDAFVSETEVARSSILSAIESLDDLYDEMSRSYVFDLFFTSKAEEIAAVFDDSPLSSQAYDVLRRVDPANLSKYDKLVN
ncbi:MAG: DUF4835 family protein [Rhodothermales bacterium]